MPEAASSAGDDCIEFAAEFGLHLDPWQQYVIRSALGERDDGRWQCFEVGLVVPRQNGKGAVLEALELFWLFLCDEDRLILHSAHEFKSAREGFLRLRGLIEANAEYSPLVAQFYASTGGECGIELRDGKRIRFLARSKGAARGFSGDKLVLDEAFNLPDTTVDAVLPTTGARPNPQVWYTSSPGDYNIAPCDALARVRRRALAHDDPALAYFEWSAPYNEEGELLGSPTDRRLWAQAQPGLGIRKPEERIANYQASMSPSGFAREELGCGRWPKDIGMDSVFGPSWHKCSTTLEPKLPVALGFAVSIDQSWASLGAIDNSEAPHIAPVLRSRIPEQVAAEAARISVEKNIPVAVDLRGPAAYLIESLREQRAWVVEANTEDYVTACAEVYAAVTHDPPEIAHGDYPELNEAAAATVTRPVGDRWAWARKEGEISMIEAVTLAWWAKGRFDYDLLASVL